MDWRFAIAMACAAPLMSGPSMAADARALEGHGGPIMDVALSPDGKMALTASFDNSVGLWDLNTGHARWLEGHEAAVKTVLYLGIDRAASAGDDFAIEIWDLKKGERLHRLEGHRGQIKSLAVSPDGSKLASASWDGTVGIWDLDAGLQIGTLGGHAGAVNDVAWSSDGKQIYSASADGTIRLWDRETLAIRRILVRHGFAVTGFVVNEAKGWIVYGAVDGGTRALSLTTDQVLADLTLERRPILALAASPDYRRIAVGDGMGFIMIVDTENWSIAHDFRATKKGPIWALAYSADGASVLAGGIDDTAYFWPIGQMSGGPIMSGTVRDFLRDPATMSNGERQFSRKCSICHSLMDDKARRAGPSLRNLFGRVAGTVAGYNYSQVMAKSGIVWSDETIDRLFDLGPEHYVPGTKMPMQRIADPKDRDDLINFLRDRTRG